MNLRGLNKAGRGEQEAADREKLLYKNRLEKRQVVSDGQGHEHRLLWAEILGLLSLMRAPRSY